VKRLRNILLALTAALALMPGAARATTVLAGDLNNDGRVTITDAQIALRIAVGMSVGNDTNVIAAATAPLAQGADAQGKITINQVVAILRLAIGLDTQEKYASDAGGGGGGTKPPIAAGSVEYSVSTPRGSYAPSELIPLTVTLRNNTDHDISFTTPDSCESDLVVKDAAGNAVWSPTAICGMVTYAYTLKPGETRVKDYQWSNADQKPRPKGTYTAEAHLKGSDYSSVVSFQVSDQTTPIPPGDGSATFDLTPGRGQTFVNTNGKNRRDETIRFLQYVKAGDQYYTLTSMTPDGARNALLRLDDDNELLQRNSDGTEGVRLKLNAKEGETWTLEEEGSSAKATLTSRNATLKTPAGLYTNLLQFDFFVGPDNSWTEWVSPKGIWVGYSRETIAGPIDYALSGSEGVGIPVSSNAKYSAVLYPNFVNLQAGEQVQFGLLVADQSGKLLKDLPGPVRWSVEGTAGTIDQSGLFIARGDDVIDKALVRADIQLLDSNITAEGEAVVGETVVTPPMPPPVVTPPDRQGLILSPNYVRLLPGARQQFTPVFTDENGKQAQLDNPQWGADPNIGAIDTNGLFTAADLKEGAWGGITFQAVYQGMVVQGAAKVYVGPDADQEPVPTDPPIPAYRLQFKPFPYAYVQPGAQQQFTATVIDKDGNPVAAQITWHLEKDANYGTITPEGLFTATSDKRAGLGGPVYAQAVIGGDQVIEDYAKVIIGDPPISEPMPVPDPGPTPPPSQQRLAFLEGGSLKLSVPSLAQPETVLQADIDGSMPDPSWSYLDTKVSVEGDQIILTPILQQTGSGPVIAVIRPFHATVSIKGVPSGKTYNVIAVGADTKLSAQIKL
jgi:hypothetical protein